MASAPPLGAVPAAPSVEPPEPDVPALLTLPAVPATPAPPDGFPAVPPAPETPAGDGDELAPEHDSSRAVAAMALSAATTSAFLFVFGKGTVSSSLALLLQRAA
jgi:hypothetical protein